MSFSEIKKGKGGSPNAVAELAGPVGEGRLLGGDPTEQGWRALAVAMHRIPIVSMGGGAGMRQMAASTKVPASVRRRRRCRVCETFGVSVGDVLRQQCCRVVDGAVDVGVCRRSWEDVGICASGSSDVGIGVMDVGVCRHWWVDAGACRRCVSNNDGE